MKKILFGLVMVALIALSYILGSSLATSSYTTPLLACTVQADIPFEDYETIVIGDSVGKMLRNYYGVSYSFREHITPTGTTLEEYYALIDDRGFTYFYDRQNQVIACGFYK